MDDQAAIDAYLAMLRARIGRRTRTIEHEVEKGAIARFARAVGATSPLHFDEAAARASRFGAIVAPPTFASTFLAGLVPDEVFDRAGTPFAHALHSDDRVDNRRPIRAGDRLFACAEYADAFLKDGRRGPMLFQRADLMLTDRDGDTVAVVAVTSVSF